MSGLCYKRIIAELGAYQRGIKSKDALIYSISPHEECIQKWDGIIYGPIDTPYEGGLFRCSIEFPKTYPFNPPKIVFKTPMFHPNISTSGSICLDILDGKWQSCMTVEKVLLSLSSLLMDGNPDSPLNSDAAALMKKGKDAYDKAVRDHVTKHALGG
ncbi:probable ubiquitin-conjugating enzyme E2 31 [Aduncisulcus paluster]|uniref:Probable ubiquitin-conjugating enzyme E2 31 n=1 Tax=Aduncisulcus paluster TaxID=2918883 RepID=A0ABQ5KJC1_9EUKA|nr:probable ubiquitin-conjugating enzyme E2 31 [Aduncisulcus paluster]|eukprot:gnl/Carplike_NY0171/3133_a4207_472.p1 GENE.gnl/Carplike_NY0171/3133_a4207_472~~gnl/Carplike_NY0171/3133_a4207_472.p1  ORF type:complete len:157 (+),score=27.23 gnl/Carplike_NY0171/3133_a4207_472:124-594(+)